MAPQIEANSLSEIIQLASNPPKYPRNPTEAVRPSLVLYIARVPGSRDIILTTLKPQVSNVTAADVASSLYYLHLDNEDDERLLSETHQEGGAPKMGTAERPVPRKPLPPSARSSMDIQRGQNQNLPSMTEPPAKYIGMPPDALPRDYAQKPVTSIPRRPLATRTTTSESIVSRKPLPMIPGTENQPPGDHATTHVDGLPPLPPRPLITTTESFSSVYSSSTPGFDTRRATPFSITLIRRDPSSGGQWNIGKLVGQPLPDDGTRGRSHQQRSYYSMSISIMTPGYTWFREPMVATNANTNGNDDRISIDSAGAAGHPSTVKRPEFHRQIELERSNFWEKTPKQQSNRHSLQVRAAPRMTHARSSSDHLATIPGSGSNPSSTSNSRANGYVFLSPWGGRCIFSTKGGGRALTCRHTLPERVSSSNPTGATPTVALSELRFNLPASSVFKVSTPPTHGGDRKHFPMSKFGHIRNKLSSDENRPPLPPRPPSTSYAALYPSDDEEEGEIEERLDLSMGQEKAGGGFRGRRAKLGKLIIHDEGLKMIDLIVAANMSVWWSVWESGQRD